MEPGGSKPTKRTGRTVESRYKQAAQQKSMRGNLSTTTMNCTKSISRTPSCLNETNMNWNQSQCAQRMDCISTPSNNNCRLPECDESAIVADQSCMPILKESLATVDKRTHFVPKRNIKNKGEKSTAPLVALPKAAKDDTKNQKQLQEYEINLLYNRYVQAVYLESRSKKVLEIKADSAMKSLHKVWQANQIFTKKNKIIQQELDCLQYMLQLIEFCGKKRKFYEENSDVVRVTMEQYEEVCRAVETLKNKLKIIDVDFVDSVPKDELLNTAKEYEELINSIFCAFPAMLSELPDVASALEKLTKLQSEIRSEISTCTTLMSATNQLATNQCYLEICKIADTLVQ